MDWISIITSLSYALYYPLYYALYSLVFLLSFLATLLRMLATPLLLFGGYLLHVSLFPFRVLEKFENICTFFGTAVVIGLVTGLILYFTSSFIFQLLELSPEISAQHHPLTRRGHQKRPKGFAGFQPRSTLHNWKPDRLNYLTAGSDRDFQSSVAGPSSTVKKDADGYYTTWKDEYMGDSKERDLLSTMILEEDDDHSEPSGP